MFDARVYYGLVPISFGARRARGLYRTAVTVPPDSRSGHACRLSVKKFAFCNLLCTESCTRSCLSHVIPCVPPTDGQPTRGLALKPGTVLEYQHRGVAKALTQRAHPTDVLRLERVEEEMGSCGDRPPPTSPCV